MKAIKFLGNKNLEIIDTAKPIPGKGFAVVKVMASGICRTDIDFFYEKAEPTDITGGHEVTGIVDQPAVPGMFEKGDRVLLNCHWTCGSCKHCLAGDLIFCTELKALGFEFNGGYAEYVLAPESILRRLPDDISLGAGIIAGDALGTAYHAVKKAGVVKGDRVGVIGVGPVGLMAVASATYFGEEVFAIDVINERLEMAKEMGAAKILNPLLTNIEEQVKEDTSGDGLDTIIECTGSSDAINNALKLLKFRGKMIFVGVCTGLNVNAYDLITAREIVIIGSRNYHDSELEEIFGLIRKNPFIEKIITNRFKIIEASAAFKMAEERKGLKIILTP